MNNTKQESGANALEEDEFQKILDCSVQELLQTAWKDQWKIKHIEFWLKVKNAQNFEDLTKMIRDRLQELDQPVIL